MEQAVLMGERLKALRIKNNLTRADVASRCGISESAVRMYENGIRTPRDAVKVELSRLFGVKIDDLFFAY